jgi:hypothetical protein
MGVAKYQGVEVDFREKTIGNGKSRGITVKCGSRKQDYKFTPNPHDADAWYNKNQIKFYEEAATQLAKLFHDSNTNAANRLFPRYGKKITVHNTEYTLASPQ